MPNGVYREAIFFTKIQLMKKTSIHLMLAIIFSTIVLAGCTKSKDGEESVAATKENLAGSYKLTEFKSKTSIPGMENVDGLATMDACEKDDIYKLNADFTASYTDAGSKCDPDGSYSGINWELAGNVISIPGSSQDYMGTIKSFNGKTLVIESSVVYMGISATVTATFTKQ